MYRSISTQYLQYEFDEDDDNDYDDDDDDDDDSDDEDDYIFEGRSQKHPEGRVLKKMGGHPLSPKMGGV